MMCFMVWFYYWCLIVYISKRGGWVWLILEVWWFKCYVDDFLWLVGFVIGLVLVILVIWFVFWYGGGWVVEGFVLLIFMVCGWLDDKGLFIWVCGLCKDLWDWIYGMMGCNVGVDKVMNIVMVWKRKEKVSSLGWKIKRIWE